MPVNEFEKQVQQKLNELQLRPTPAVWTEVEKQIRKEKKRRRIIIFWWLLPVLLTGGIATWYFNNSNVNRDGIATSARLQEKQTSTAPGPGNPKDQTQNSPQEQSQPINDHSTIITEKIQAAPDHKPVATPQQSTIVKKQATNLTIQDSYNISVDKAAIIKKQKATKNQSIINGNTEVVVITPGLTKNKPAVEAPVAEKTPIRQEPLNNAQTAIAEKNIDSTVITEPATVNVTKTQTPEPEMKMPVTVSKRKWQFGAELTVGMADTREFELFHGEKAMLDAIPNGNPGAGFASGPVAAPVLTSSPEAGLSAGLDLYARKDLSKRISIRAGLHYQYFSTQLKVGDKIDNTRTVSNDMSLLVVSSYYMAANSGAPLSNYTNQYHYAGISGYLSWKFIQRKKFNLSWENGITLNRLVNTNALLYDMASRSFYEDKTAFHKVQFSLSTGLEVPLFNLGGVNVSARPYASFGMVPILKGGSSNTHFVNYGMGFKFLFPRK